MCSDPQSLAEEASTNGSNGCLSPDRSQQPPSKPVARPLSPDSPEIISELQRYTVASASGGSSAAPERGPDGPPGPPGSLLTSKVAQSNGSGGDVSVAAMIQPNMEAAGVQDLRTASKRKASPPAEERPTKQPPAARHAAALPPQGFPFSGGYGLPALGLSPAVLGGSLGHPLFMGSGTPYFQPPHPQLGDPSYLYPELFGFGGAGAAPASSSSPSTTTAAPASSSSSSSPPSPSASVQPSGSVAGALPPFLLGPGMAGMAGMLPPGFPLSYSQSLASLYSGSMLPGGLPGPAATPGPGGSSFLSQYPPTAASGSSCSSPSSFSPSARSEGQRGPLLVNGGNVSSGGSSDEDDDVIEVKGQ